LYISDYFRRVDQVVSDCPAIISKELLFDQRTKYIGFVRGQWFLEMAQNCTLKNSLIPKLAGYHYQKADSMIFRYDNHPHPARKDIPYCHKHVSTEENMISASIPDLEDILKEVIMYLP